MPHYLEEVDLLPCPFCGGEAGMYQRYKNGYSIHCKKCKISIDQKVLRKSMEWLKDIMIANWNTRVQPQILIDSIIKEVAQYMKTEGCTCCQDYDGHNESKDRLGELLGVPMYSDNSGRDFHQFMEWTFQPGDKVHYIPTHARKDPSQWEDGIVKRITDDGEGYFVVYKCNGDWDNYMNFTAARTNKSDLNPGWEKGGGDGTA